MLDHSALVVIDKSIPDYSSLVAGLPNHRDLVLVESDQDGFLSITKKTKRSIKLFI